MPGGVDPHTHFDLPMFGTVSSDDHYTGHKAAAFGGTTTVIDFVPQDFPSLEQSVEAWRLKADPKAAVDFGFHMNITRLDESTEREIPRLPELGITTLKVFTAYNGRLRLQDGEIFRAMRIAQDRRPADHAARRERRCDRYIGRRSAGLRSHRPGVACPHPPGLGRRGSRPARGRPGRPGGGARCTSST